MNCGFRIVCLLTISCVALWSAGCSNKTGRSGGITTRSASAPIDSASDYYMTHPAGTERLSPGIAVAKVDPATARRQMDELRAEQAATAAAGLRDVFFGYDSWTINEKGRQALIGNADWLHRHPAVQLKVEGHCDERGSSTYNFVLAEKRAKSVRNYLMDLGIGRERLIVVSYGKERPFCKDRSEACYQQNRRGHLVVRP
jgi:peptidoglycan-associated lipoprotein